MFGLASPEYSVDLEGEVALREVETRVTEIWDHPLLTNLTIEHRRKGRKMFEDFISQHNLSCTDYVGSPFGSSIWITSSTSDSTSDHDFNVIARNRNAKYEFNSSLFSGHPLGLSYS